MVAVYLGRSFREMEVGGFGWADFSTWGEGYLCAFASSKGGRGSLCHQGMSRGEIAVVPLSWLRERWATLIPFGMVSKWLWQQERLNVGLRFGT